jgi:hypothetical protein
MVMARLGSSMSIKVATSRSGPLQLQAVLPSELAEPAEGAVGSGSE